jgi:hypothetical protein
MLSAVIMAGEKPGMVAGRKCFFLDSSFRGAVVESCVGAMMTIWSKKHIVVKKPGCGPSTAVNNHALFS